MPLITVNAGTPIVPPGTYPATLVGVRPKKLVTKFSKNGEEQDFLEWTWLVDGPDKEAEITSLTSLSTGPKSTMFMVLTALLGKDAVQIGAGFDEGDLVGKAVMVGIIEQDGFSKIDQIMAPPKTKAPKPVAVAAPPTAAVADKDDEPVAVPALGETADSDDTEDDLPF